LVHICETKIDEYINKRGNAIWNHRRLNRNHIPGTIRYEVLKRAGFRCESCGISADERALEVDHIEPVNTGGENSIHNYQALCYICNASKGDRDNTDFRNQGKIYAHRKEGCLFCEIDPRRIVHQDNLAYLIDDKFPVTPGHCLIIPKRHFDDYFEITQAESNCIQTLLRDAKKRVSFKDKSIQGFNLGINSGQVAGQTILHTHMHLIPRRINDVAIPTGGIRNIIPRKGDYK
jgi:diadenosine tetraphosphate (Ap4A) HIT family hydrolase